MSGSIEQIESVSAPLAKELAERIRHQGRVTFHDWMESALYHPTLGYYNRTDLKRWGREGDYRTSPERSELFPATFARYFISLYEQMRCPSEFHIVEMGAGDGSFAAGVLEALEKSSPSMSRLTKYVVVETSNDARQRAAKELQSFAGQIQFTSLANLEPIQTGIVFSNELLDSFPVHRVTSIHGELKELFVALAGDGRFIWLIDDPSSTKLVDFCLDNIPTLIEGQIVEVNMEIGNWLQVLGEKLIAGFLITIDYGAEAEDLYSPVQRPKGSLRAFHRHTFADDVLANPGENDITSSVDWTYLKAEGTRRGFEVKEFSQLDRFLMTAGILDELETRLAQAASEADRSCLTTSAREMILPGGMASSFQVLVQKR